MKVGLAIVAAHAAAFAYLVAHCHRDELAVENGRANTDRAVVVDDPPGPGLHHKRWTVAYRGGFERFVGVARLDGPYQDGKACTGRIVVGERLLAQIGSGIKKQLVEELRGESIFGIGDFVKVDDFALRWAELANHPDDADMIGKAPHGYIAVQATIEFERASVPIHLALIPDSGQKFRIAARAELAFDNRVLQWVSNRLRGDKLATRLARRQIDDAIATTLAPPPPFPIGDGAQLQFTYCDEPPEIREAAYGALPFAVVTKAGVVPRFGPGPRVAPTRDTTLALDLDLDALNAMLYELWRVGYLDKRLADAGLDRRFNDDATVQEFLTLRITPVTLALPPVISPGPRLSAEARTTISGTVGRIWGGLDFHFANGTLGVDLGALELSCERTPTTLVPCYSDLVAQIRGRGADIHGALTSALLKLLSDIFVDRRVAIAGMPGELVVRGATPSAPDGRVFHLDLDAALH